MGSPVSISSTPVARPVEEHRAPTFPKSVHCSLTEVVHQGVTRKVADDDRRLQRLVPAVDHLEKHQLLGIGPELPPDPINVDDIKKLDSRDNGELKEASNDEAADIGELRTIKEQIKELQEQEKAVASRVILAIGEKTGLTIGGQKAVTYKAQNSSRFSSTAFKKEHPDLYADFVQTTSTQILRLA